MNKRLLGLIVAVPLAIASVAGINAAVSGADPQPAFEAKFETASDFYDRFDYGYSGIGPFQVGPMAFHGDHDMDCNGPTTDRSVGFSGTTPALNFEQLFWHCAPGMDANKGHIMTGVDTLGYNIAWFSPKPTFTGITKVCWDINETTMSTRKWTQVLFVGNADATRYPAGQLLPGSTPNYTRGSGGFDLGYTAPDFRQNAPNTGIFPDGGTLAGLRENRAILDWFDQQDHWVTQGKGWPGLIPQFNPGGQPIVDKAGRYQHCIENVDPTHIKSTIDTPFGPKVETFLGSIPQDARRVVFQDDNYDPAKGDNYSSTILTWHWDNIQVYAASSSGGGGGTTTTTVPTTPAPTTTIVTTTTTAPTTTQPTTTTSSTTTTVDPCPSTFNAEERAWCQSVEARLP